MGSEWETVCIDQIKSPQKYSCVGGPFGSSLSRKHYVDTGVPVIRGVNLSGDIFSESEFVFVSPEKSQELQRNMAFRGDLVFTQRGTLGQVALIPENSDYECYVVSQSQMKLTVDPTKADPYFIYSYFRSKEAKTVIEKSAIVGGVPHINLGILKDFRLRLPPLSVQQAVSKIAKDFDRKMLLNNQINQTLEQMAQTLFKSWFVDFDPVIDNVLDAGSYIPEIFEARVERRKTVRESADFKPLPDDVRQLFPSEFEESELGWVPKGWGIDSIYSCADLIYGAPFKSKQFNEDRLGLPVIRIRDLKTGKPRYFTEEDHPKKTLVRTGDILVGMDAEFRATIWSGSQGYLNQRLFYLKPKGENISNLFLKYTIQPLLDLEERAQVGTTVAHLGKKDIDKFRILVPTTNILEVSKVHFSELLSRIVEIYCENTALEKLRDTLLPKLISGELRLDSPEVEQAKALVE
jgi:type I restriction enzyme S subunit